MSNQLSILLFWIFTLQTLLPNGMNDEALFNVMLYCNLDLIVHASRLCMYRICLHAFYFFKCLFFIFLMIYLLWVVTNQWIFTEIDHELVF